MSISKHHYAQELSKKNEVWFLNAPDQKFGLEFKSENVSDFPRLNIIRYTLPMQQFFFFHFNNVYKRVNQFFIAKWLKQVTPEFDVCIDFGNYLLYDNVNFVKAKLKIYFPVDDFENLKVSLRGSDVAFSVSEKIIKKFESHGLDCHFVNHGLASEFAGLAKQRLHHLDRWENKPSLNIAYAGNLYIPFINFKALMAVIKANPGIHFHFFGSTQTRSDILWHDEWQSFLASSANVKLYGVVNSKKLADYFAGMDAFLLCYTPDNKNYHAENSHKIFEYFSTGKVIIATPITIYNKNRLFCMSDDATGFFDTFTKAIAEIGQHNEISQQKERIMLALDNEYTRQVEKMEVMINHLGIAS